jgi:hypothetical protein
VACTSTATIPVRPPWAGTNLMSAYQARHYNCGSDKARWQGGNQARSVS